MTGAINGCELLCGNWEPNPTLPKEQQALLTVELSLQPPSVNSVKKTFYHKVIKQEAKKLGLTLDLQRNNGLCCGHAFNSSALEERRIYPKEFKASQEYIIIHCLNKTKLN